MLWIVHLSLNLGVFDILIFYWIFKPNFPLFLANLFSTSSSNSSKNQDNHTKKMEFDKEKLKERLTPLQYHVTQEAGTERAGTGK